MKYLVLLLILMMLTYLSQAKYSRDIQKSGIGPENRMAASMAINPFNLDLYIFGGINEVYYNDLWVFSLSSRKWKILYPFSETPGKINLDPRMNPAGLVRNTTQEFCIYGGRSYSKVYTDLWCYDIKKFKWKLISTYNSPPVIKHIAFTYYNYENQDFLAIAGSDIFSFDLKFYMYFIIRLDFRSKFWQEFNLDFTFYNGEFEADGIKVPKITIHYYESAIYIHVFSEAKELQKIFMYNLETKTIIISSYSASLRCDFELKYIFSTVFNDTLYSFYNPSTVLGMNLFNYSDISKSNIENFNIMYPALCAYENKIFSFGGRLYINSLKTKKVINSIFEIEFLENDKFALTTISENYLSPQTRFAHSMHLIKGNFYLFGGKSQKTYYNDLWDYNPITDIWKQISAPGDSPSPRAFFASDSEGDAMIIWGGEGSDGLKNDMFLYNAFKNTWSKIIPQTSLVPSKRKAACIALMLPYAYIIGGFDSYGICNDVWKFNFGNNTYEKLSFVYESAFLHCFAHDSDIYIIGGDDFKEFALDTNKRILKVMAVETLNLGNIIQDIFINLDPYYIRIGGRDITTDSLKNFIDFTFPENEYLSNIDDYPSASAYIFYNTSVYYHGGNYYTTQVTPFLDLPRPKFAKIDLFELCQDIGCTMACAKGFYYKSNSCHLCPPGTYNDLINSTKCWSCDPGYYNPSQGASSQKQCYPCPEGSFNSEFNGKLCKICPQGYSCPTGSREPIIIGSFSIKNAVIQPVMYKGNYPSQIIFIVQIGGGLITAIVLIFTISFHKLRRLIPVLDMYSNLHFTEDGSFLQIRKNFIGGFFTIIFVGICSIAVISVMSIFFLDNVVESKSLIPLVILEEEVPKFYTNFEMEINLKNYGDYCEKQMMSLEISNEVTCSNNVLFYTVNVKRSQNSISCRMEGTTCKINYKCKNCEINAESYVKIDLQQRQSYATEISINVTSDSSIPESRSSVLSILNPDKGYIFIGPVPNEFYFSMTPSLFRSSVYSFPSLLTGYHVDTGALPQIGSQNLIENMALSTGVSIKIVLQKVASGLYTERSAKQSGILLASSLFGTVTGLMSFVGGIMSQSESVLTKKKKKMIIKHNLKNVIKKEAEISSMYFGVQEYYVPRKNCFRVKPSSDNTPIILSIGESEKIELSYFDRTILQNEIPMESDVIPFNNPKNSENGFHERNMSENML
ncbi:hypothetical protein SteCoe_11941 [Stentor coeruleus]|uniref:Tyrosine-protein kinase ephrin type A/B receptor-like domain-containing protein n=1 Tax=Stentor coeruleus TaxID=5963 RepID=A0A1R2CC13_9CILI|nr:hypothetical protein SteCoe_11941 [Stentor coeruleus]